MSEYQYYEFQAIDRPLTKAEMAELRALSTRASISPTRFVNVYNWGDFRGDPLALMKQYFDAFLYVANWGMHWFMLRLPRSVLDPETAERYCVADGASLHVADNHVILAFESEDDDGGDEDGEECLASLVPLRSELSAGDLRALYLGWLLCAQNGMLDDEDVEPPPPPGLRSLSASLRAFAEFLRIDEDLIEVAAAGSAELEEVAPSSSDLERWIAGLSAPEKDALLLRIALGEAPHPQGQLMRRFREATALASPTASDRAGGGRTVAELLSLAEERTEVRRRQEAERKAAERARLAQERAAARAAYLDGLAGREEDLWRQVEALVETKRPTDYDRAAQLVKDLGDLAVRDHAAEAFAARLTGLRARHAKKPSLLARLDRVGLPRASAPA